MLWCAVLDTSSDEEAGVYRSLDGGKSWAPCNRGIVRDPQKIAGDPDARPLPNVPVDTMAGRCLAPTLDGKTLFCGTAGGLYRSEDRGDHWKRCGEQAGLTGAIATVAIHPTRQDVMFVGIEGRVFGTRDGGKTWQCMSNGLRVSP